MSVPSPENVRLAEDYVNRARVKLEEARRQMQSIQYDTCISASQECIELSVKGIFLMLLGDYQPQHEARESEFKRMLSSTPDGIGHIDFARIWMVNKFWATFYTTAKYGNKQLGVSAARLFRKEDAELALKHADDVYTAASTIRYWRLTSMARGKT
jgi:HEPN domain-containing protein